MPHLREPMSGIDVISGMGIEKQKEQLRTRLLLLFYFVFFWILALEVMA